MKSHILVYQDLRKGIKVVLHAVAIRVFTAKLSVAVRLYD